MAREIAMENVRIGFKNFEGREGPYNRKGERDFVVFLDSEFAKQLESEGWKIIDLLNLNDMKSAFGGEN